MLSKFVKKNKKGVEGKGLIPNLHFYKLCDHARYSKQCTCNKKIIF